MGNKIASERAQPHYLAHCETKLGLLRASPVRKKSMDSIAYSSNDPQKMKSLKVGFLSLGVVGIYYLAPFINATENVPRCHQCPPGPNMRASWTGWTRSRDEGNESCSVVSNSWRPMGYRVDGILQARILEWVAFPFTRGLYQRRDRSQVSCIAGRFFTC